MQWKKALEEYGYYLRLEQGLSENTIEGYQFDVKRLMRYCKSLDNSNKPQNVDADTLKILSTSFQRRYNRPPNRV